MRSLVVVTATLLFGFASSVPVHEKRTAGVYLSTEPEWGDRETKGSFSWFGIIPHRCTQLQGTDYYHHVGSFGPDKGIWCTIWDGNTCEGANEPVYNPGYARMMWNGWDTKMGSYNCTHCDPGTC